MPKQPRLRVALTQFRNAVAVGDCLDPLTGLPVIPDKHFSHCITDPPYGERTHAKKWSGSGAAPNGKEHRGQRPTSKPVTFSPMTAELIAAVSKEIVRTTRGWALVFSDSDLLSVWRDAFTEAGALRWVTCIWTSPNRSPQFRGEGPAQPCEYIVCSWCGQGRPSWNGGGKLGEYRYPIETGEPRRHETQKPLELMKALVLDFTCPGDLVVDPYAGSGQTAVAAKMLGRDYVCWEKDPKMAASARDYLRGVREQLTLAESHFHARPAAFGRKKPKRPKQEEFDAAR